MLKYLITIIALFTASVSFAQMRLSKYNVGETGCAAYFPAEPVFDLSYSEDSSSVYTVETVVDSYHFGMICVQFKDAIGYSVADNTMLLKSYLDFLKSQFNIVSAVGYGEGHTMESNPNAAGVIDYWEDADGSQWQVKGWVDNNFIAVLYVYGVSEPNYTTAQLFLNGFRFPE